MTQFWIIRTNPSQQQPVGLTVSLDMQFHNLCLIVMYRFFSHSSGLSPLYSPVAFCGAPLGPHQKRIQDLSLNSMIGKNRLELQCNMGVLVLLTLNSLMQGQPFD